MSRQPGSGNGLVYDEKLLDQAPQVTKGQRQEGYDADILNPTPPPASRSPPIDYNERNADVESGTSPHEKHLAAGGYDPVEHGAKKPFWKTTKGLIIIAVLALVIIAAAVGGGVGGSVGKHKNNNAVLGAGNTTSSASSSSTHASASTVAVPGEQPATTTQRCSGDCAAATTGSASITPSPRPQAPNSSSVGTVPVESISSQGEGVTGGETGVLTGPVVAPTPN